MALRHSKTSLSLGDTFVANFGGEVPHLWVVIGRDGLRPVIVNLTTMRPGCDPAARFRRGEHPWIKHPTVANFAGMLDVDESKILKAQRLGDIRVNVRASPQVLIRLREGAAQSSRTPLRLRSLFEVRRPVDTREPSPR